MLRHSLLEERTSFGFTIIEGVYEILGYAAIQRLYPVRDESMLTGSSTAVLIFRVPPTEAPSPRTQAVGPLLPKPARGRRRFDRNGRRTQSRQGKGYADH